MSAQKRSLNLLFQPDDYDEPVVKGVTVDENEYYAVVQTVHADGTLHARTASCSKEATEVYIAFAPNGQDTECVFLPIACDVEETYQSENEYVGTLTKRFVSGRAVLAAVHDLPQRLKTILKIPTTLSETTTSSLLLTPVLGGRTVYPVTYGGRLPPGAYVALWD